VPDEAMQTCEIAAVDQEEGIDMAQIPQDLAQIREKSWQPKLLYSKKGMTLSTYTIKSFRAAS